MALMTRYTVSEDKHHQVHHLWVPTGYMITTDNSDYSKVIKLIKDLVFLGEKHFSCRLSWRILDQDCLLLRNYKVKAILVKPRKYCCAQPCDFARCFICLINKL